MAYNNRYYSNPNYYNRSGNGYMNNTPYQQPTPKVEIIKEERDFVDQMPIAMCYEPWQKWDCVYDIEKGYSCGTIFPELNKPFRGGK